MWQYSKVVKYPLENQVLLHKVDSDRFHLILAVFFKNLINTYSDGLLITNVWHFMKQNADFH